MNRSSLARLTAVLLLIIASGIATTQAMLTPSYAQMSVNAKSHTKGPPQPSSTSTMVTTNAAPSSTESNNNGHGRHGTGVPPGLLNAWAHSNMSVVARAVTHAIFLNGTHGVELAEIAINASSNGQLIENVAFNESVVQIDFDHDGQTVLVMNSSAKPSAVFADDKELTEVGSTIGLTPDSNGWVYDQNSHQLTIFADPASMTIYYGASPATALPEYATPLVTSIIAITTLAAAIFLVKRRS